MFYFNVFIGRPLAAGAPLMPTEACYLKHALLSHFSETIQDAPLPLSECIYVDINDELS